MAIAAGGTVSTETLTPIPIATATSAATTICAAEPGSKNVLYHFPSPILLRGGPCKRSFAGVTTTSGCPLCESEYKSLDFSSSRAMGSMIAEMERKVIPWEEACPVYNNQCLSRAPRGYRAEHEAKLSRPRQNAGWSQCAHLCQATLQASANPGDLSSARDCHFGVLMQYQVDKRRAKSGSNADLRAKRPRHGQSMISLYLALLSTPREAIMQAGISAIERFAAWHVHNGVGQRGRARETEMPRWAGLSRVGRDSQG